MTSCQKALDFSSVLANMPPMPQPLDMTALWNKPLVMGLQD